jgi:tRNA(Glu) U13 pseudouridine synthase TruD
MIKRARSFQCSLLGDGSGTSGTAAGEGNQSVVVQFELAAGCYATCFLFEMCECDGT